jgi:hypothetical protein
LVAGLRLPASFVAQASSTRLTVRPIPRRTSAGASAERGEKFYQHEI